MKKTTLNLALTLSLSMILNSNANASGIPVVDTQGIQQSILSYIQDQLAQAKDYAMQLQQFQEIQKQAESAGAYLKDFQAIYGQTIGIIEDSISLYDEIVNLPNDVFGRFEKAYNICDEIANLPQAKNLQEGIKKAKNLQGKFSSCSTAISNTGNFIKDINAINDDLTDLYEQRARLGDKSGELTKKIFEKEEEKRQLEVLKKQAETSIQEAQLTELANKLDYIEEKETKQYLKDMQKFQSQLSQAKTDKEIAAATNALLYYNIQQQQKMYDLQSKYFKAEVAEKQAHLTQIDDYEKIEADTRSLAEMDKDFAESVEKGKKVPKDAFGIPNFLTKQ